MPNLENAFYRIVDLLDNGNAVAEKMPNILREVCTLYGLKSAAYFGINLSSKIEREPRLAVTYSSDWIDHYRARKYVDIDPVIQSGFTSMLPVVWSAHDIRAAKLKRFFGEASEFGVGTRGMTIPIRGRSSDRALFTITSEQRLSDWSASLRLVERDMQMLAFHLHQHFLRTYGTERPVPKLSPREVECLKWRASGKTNWAIAKILNISEKTVEGHLELARTKLGATTTCHAVAKALNHNLFLVAH